MQLVSTKGSDRMMSSLSTNRRASPRELVPVLMIWMDSCFLRLDQSEDRRYSPKASVLVCPRRKISSMFWATRYSRVYSIKGLLLRGRRACENESKTLKSGKKDAFTGERANLRDTFGQRVELVVAIFRDDDRLELLLLVIGGPLFSVFLRA